ncbi:MAG: hypothetical protein K2W99_04105 [Chthoniobacterales bacterium]|nr:hypothetical protein [Chthoniobacterales bacterium]
MSFSPIHNFAAPDNNTTHEEGYEVNTPPQLEGTPVEVAISAGAHSTQAGEPQSTWVDHLMQLIGDPLQAKKNAIQLAGDIPNPLKTCREGVQSLAEAGENLIQFATTSYYQTSLEEINQLKEIHLARRETFYALAEQDLFNNLTMAFDAVLQAPGNLTAQHRLWQLIDEVERRVPTIVVEADTEAVATAVPNPNSVLPVLARVTLSSQSPLDNDPKEPQARYNNLFQLQALYLGLLQKMPEESDQHEECKRLTDHFETTLGKGSRITDYDYRIAIVHKNWFRDWLRSTEVNRSSDLPNEEISIPQASLIGYNTSTH